MAGKKGRQTEKPPAFDKLLKPAIGVGLALLAYQFYKGLGRDILRVDVNNEFEIQELFYSDTKNYAVLCHEEGSKIPISSVFEDSAHDGNALVDYRIMDCKTVLQESKKTVAERFKLDLTKRPTIFVSGVIGEPKQVPQKHLKTGSMLTKTLKNLLEAKSAKIDTTQDLRVKCLNQPYCGLLLKGTKNVDTATKKAYHKLVEEFPKITFASVDTSNLYVYNLEAELDDHIEGQHRFVLFQKVSGGVGSKDARLVTSFAALKDKVNHASMSSFVTSVTAGTTPVQKLAALPLIKTRSKKVVKEEKAKRQRKLNPDSSSASGSSTANDGTKEGRRMERDKRREEHQKASGAKPKTPEEIQEMERRRRVRMEEEAAKWNIAPDDAPDEGDAVNEDNTMWDEGEDDGEVDHKDSGDGYEEGDDVMDLD